jgi:type VI secretion system protein ImpH
MGREADAVAFFAAVGQAPYAFDFYQTLRRLECLFDPRPRWGEALRPIDEPVRLGQDPDLTFAPATLASFEPARGARPPRLQVRHFGLLGPNGPMPLHFTEYVRERLRNASDPTASRFLDVFHHRFLALFYRAWAQAQPHVSRDRPEQDRFAAYIGAFIGLAPPAFRHRDFVPDEAKLFHCGALIRHVRNAEGLAAILTQFFRVPVEIEEYVGHWLVLGATERTYLGRAGARLGAGAVAGGRVWDRQHKFRIHLGPLTLAEYESFLPGGRLLRKLVDWVRQYFCIEFDWDVRLQLREAEVPALALGAGRRLGWTSWLGKRSAGTDAADLCLHAESFVGWGTASPGRPATSARDATIDDSEGTSPGAEPHE